MRALSANAAAYLHSLATNGDKMAKAILEMSQDVKVKVTGPTAGTATLACQIVDGAGNAIAGQQEVQADLNTASAATISTTNTVRLGNGTEEVWLQTDAKGQFTLTVTNPTGGELSLLRLLTPSGVVAFVPLQF